MTNIESGNSFYARSSDRPKTHDVVEPRLTGEDYLDFMSRQVFVVDPRGQGFGLRDYVFLDAYANKFFILSGKQGVFISPKEIPPELLAYYDQLGIDIPSRNNIVSVESSPNDASLISRVGYNTSADSILAQRNGSFVIPYMVTPEVEEFAQVHRFNTLVDSAAVNHMADKAEFQEELAVIAGDIAKDTGYDVVIPMTRFKAHERSFAEQSYRFLSKDGTKDIVVVKPKSASGLGIFVLRSEKGISGLSEILNKQFDEEEEVLIEELVEHNHSPSMQGARKPDTDYSHIYFGRQIISMNEDSIEYDSSQIPFGPDTVKIETCDLNKMREVHEALGERLIQGKGIAGVAGFDAVTQVSSDGRVSNFKITELNLHLPSSLAVYAAINKVFPDGFKGIAHNMNVPLRQGETVHDFIRRNNSLSVPRKQEFGMFPLNLSYTDKVDVVIFAKDAEHLNQILGGIQR